MLHGLATLSINIDVCSCVHLDHIYMYRYRQICTIVQLGAERVSVPRAACLKAPPLRELAAAGVAGRLRDLRVQILELQIAQSRPYTN